ncbi:MAG: hypothetical protein JW741_13090 [Sedimentisphaerales bacterium]|nr:hypothetical protein [Sedimentisphaerales bacterium]
MSDQWLEREALVTVKAYPNPSAKHFETVCTAAVTREEGWVRLYPVGFRSLPEEQKFKKYQCIHFRMQRQTRDQRPESYRPDEHSIQLRQVVGTDDRWWERWQWIRPTLGPSMCELRHLQEGEGRSLGCIKPRDVEDLIIEKAAPEWTGRKRAAIDQMTLFDPVETRLEKIPFVFKYRYRCESRDCPGHNQSILDWELMELYRKVRDQGVPLEDIPRQIRRKFFDELCGADKDTHLFVGNHSLYAASFMVLGVFWPPRSDVRSLF